jgi:tyrosyl-tRNA synthetase
MFRKVMGISDDLMWRYWELLTDLSLAEIGALKSREPMGVKKELAGRIVADFHSAADAKQAEEDFTREVQHGAEPANIPLYNWGAAGDIRLSQVIVNSEMAGTRSEAERLIKAGAVEIDGVRQKGMIFPAKPGTYTLRVGRKWLRFTVQA